MAKININVDTQCDPIITVLTYPTARQKAEETLPGAKQGVDKMLEDGIHTVTVASKGQSPEHTVTITAKGTSTSINNNGGETVGGDGKIVAELVFEVKNGKVS